MAGIPKQRYPEFSPTYPQHLAAGETQAPLEPSLQLPLELRGNEYYLQAGRLNFGDGLLALVKIHEKATLDAVDEFGRSSPEAAHEESILRTLQAHYSSDI